MIYATNIWDEIVTWCHGGVEPEPEFEDISYGLLYNWYAATDARNIAADGWHMPTVAEFWILKQYLDAGDQTTFNNNIAGSKIKEIGTIYWDSPNSSATNEVCFNGRGSGLRDYAIGTFVNIKRRAQYWNYQQYDAAQAYISYIEYSTQIFHTSTDPALGHVFHYKTSGHAIRLLKDTTTLTHGQTGTYVGNDGKVYRTICIGTQEWVADNLAETKYRNGDAIPVVTDNAAWTALTTAGMCAYDNDWGNV